MRKIELLIPPPLIMLATGLIMWLLAGIFPALIFPWRNSAAAAAVISLLGLLISLISVITFRRADTTVDPRRPQTTSTLVSKGIYRYSRNPMYVGVLLVLIGWAVFLSNLLSAFGPLIFIGYITRYQIIPEERLLHEKFGSAFSTYKSKVRRWI